MGFNSGFKGLIYVLAGGKRGGGEAEEYDDE